MATICVPSILPTYNGIYNQLSSLYENALDLILPSQFTLPNPIWSCITAPLLQLEQTITEMISGQLVLVTNYLIGTLTSFLGLAIEDILPSIVGLPFNLIDIIGGKIQAMVDYVLSIYDSIDLSQIFLLPSPIYPAIISPILDALNIVQVAINQYFQLLANTIVGLVNQVADILEVATLSIPSFPTLDDLYALLPSVPTLDDLLNMVVPGWGFQLAMPSPLIPNMHFPQYDFIQGLKNIYNGITNMAIGMITNFIESVFGWALSLPLFCINITTT